MATRAEIEVAFDVLRSTWVRRRERKARGELSIETLPDGRSALTIRAAWQTPEQQGSVVTVLGATKGEVLQAIRLVQTGMELLS